MDKSNIVSQAVLRHVRISPQKCRLVADLIRDRYVGEALTILQFSKKKKASTLLMKLVNSAVANAQQKIHELDVDNLYIHSIMVDRGPLWKRFRAAPMGRSARILKRTSHARIELEETQGR